MVPFVNLHGHSNASIMDAIGTPEEIFDFIVENGMNASALTDHGHMNSYVSAYLAQRDINKKQKFKFIPGCEFYFHPDLNQWQEDYINKKEAKKNKKKEKKDDEITGTIENEEETKSGKYFDPIKRRHHLIALAKNNTGLTNLFTLISKGYKDGFYRFPRIDFNDLKKYGEGIVLSSSCLGTVFGYPLFGKFPEHNIDTLIPSLLDGDPILKEKILLEMEDLVDKFVDAVGEENFYLEIQFNKLNAQHLLNKALIELSQRTGIKLVSTADFHYSNPSLWQDRELYKKLGWLNFNNFEPGQIPQSKDELKAELYPKNGDQMWDAYKETTKEYDFYDDGIVKDSITRTHDIAFQLIGDVEPDRKVKLPSFAVEKDTEPFDQLVDLCKKGLIEKGLNNNKEYIERVKEELRLIREKKFELYFLTTKKIIDLAKEEVLINFGRGSGASSLVCYVLGITNIDPIENKFLFSRFLNKYKTAWPDIDLDFSDRDKVIKSLKEKFGEENVIYISNFNLFKLKSLVKDISRFYGIEYDKVNQYVKNLDIEVAQGSLKETGDKILEPKYEDALKYSEKFRYFIEKHPEVGKHINTLYKQTRTVGTHAGGIIIGDNLSSKLPIIRSKGKFQTPWSESGTITHMEEMGWLKFDMLGIETLKTIENCISYILERHENVSKPTFKDIRNWFNKNLIEDFDKNDQKVFKHVYHKGNFAYTFQFTEKPVQEYCKKIKPKSINELSIITSIFRPGPMQSGMHEQYLKNRQTNYEYENEIMKEVLEETSGIYAYQEQIMELGNKLGKIPQDECDILRKVISKKPQPGSPMEQKAFALEDKFVKGAIENGMNEKRARKIFDDFKKFAKYSFNKCLHKETNVETKNGYKKIKDVKVNEFVNSKNGFVRVNDVIKNGRKKLYKIKTKLGKELVCTMEHKIETTNGMVPLKEIIENKDKIFIKNSLDEIVSIEYFDEDETYDLEVDHSDHSFYAEDVSVSNSHSTSYSTLSYICAHLFTYYEPEWLCAYVESTSNNPDKRQIALSTIRKFGYRIEKLDINKAQNKWTILQNKKFMPPLYSVKSVGDKAIEEIENSKPINSIYDFWDENDKWKFSKFNSRALGNLIKLGAFDSLDCVGEDKLFKNYKQMYEVVVNNLKELKKKKGKENLERLAINNSYMDDWSNKEKFEMHFELTGELNVDLLLTDEIRKIINKSDAKPINEHKEINQIYWFYCHNSIIRKTKTGKHFELLFITGNDGAIKKLYIWNFKKGIDNKVPTGGIRFSRNVKSNEFGYQTFKDSII